MPSPCLSFPTWPLHRSLIPRSAAAINTPKRSGKGGGDSFRVSPIPRRPEEEGEGARPPHPGPVPSPAPAWDPREEGAAPVASLCTDFPLPWSLQPNCFPPPRDGDRGGVARPCMGGAAPHLHSLPPPRCHRMSPHSPVNTAPTGLGGGSQCWAEPPPSQGAGVGGGGHRWGPQICYNFFCRKHRFPRNQFQKHESAWKHLCLWCWGNRGHHHRDMGLGGSQYPKTPGTSGGFWEAAPQEGRTRGGDTGHRSCRFIPTARNCS